MTKFQLLAAAGVAALATACAGTHSASNTNTAARQNTTTSTAASTTTQTAAYTDAQLRAYIAARTAVDPLLASLASQTPEQQAQTNAQVIAILDRNGIDGLTYNAISRRASEDRTFATRLAALEPDTFSDQTLVAFTRASTEIEPINRNLATATPEQRTQATEQIRQILERNAIDSATYNAIAARAQADPALAARIAELYRATQNPG